MKKIIIYIVILFILSNYVFSEEIDRVTFSPNKKCVADINIDINRYNKHSDELVQLVFPMEIVGESYYSPEEGGIHLGEVKGTIDIKEQEILCYDNKRSIEVPSPKSHIKYIIDNQFPERFYIESKAAYGIVIYEKPQDFYCDGNAILSIRNIQLPSPNKCLSLFYPFDSYNIEFGFNFKDGKIGFNVDDSKIKFQTYQIGIYRMNESSFIKIGNIINFSEYNDSEVFLNIKYESTNEHVFIQILFILLSILIILYSILSFSLLKDKVIDAFFVIIPLTFEIYSQVSTPEHLTNLFDLIMIFWIMVAATKIGLFFLYRNKFRVKLQIEELNRNQDLRVYHFRDTGYTRKFANVHVKNSSNITARNCVATFKIINKPRRVSHLEREYPIHWADVPYSSRTNETQLIDIGRGTRRLDLTFAQMGIDREGCWVAIPLALLDPLSAMQAYLPPGNYVVEVKITCENGIGDKKKYKIISPRHWEDLDISELQNKLIKFWEQFKSLFK